MGDFLDLSPNELRFRFELRKNVPVTLSLTNTTQDRVAFKVKTTSPKKYCVRPSTGYVDPGSNKDVQVILQAQREPPPSLSDCKDKFLVQSLKIGPETTEITPDLFEAGPGKTIKQSKLRVVLVGPPKPPSPVPEGIEEESSPVRTVFKEDSTAALPPLSTDDNQQDPNSEFNKVVRERNRLRDQLNKMEADKAEIKRRLDAVGTHNPQSMLQTQQNTLRAGRFTPVHLAIVAIIAFILGVLIF